MQHREAFDMRASNQPTTVLSRWQNQETLRKYSNFLREVAQSRLT